MFIVIRASAGQGGDADICKDTDLSVSVGRQKETINQPSVPGGGVQKGALATEELSAVQIAYPPYGASV